jgi:hypothetical protein
MHYLELLSEFWMLAPVTRQAQRLSSVNIGKAPNNGYQVTRRRHLQTGHRVARVLGMEGDPFHDSLDMF